MLSNFHPINAAKLGMKIVASTSFRYYIHKGSILNITIPKEEEEEEIIIVTNGW